MTGFKNYYLKSRGEDVKNPGMLYNPSGHKADWAVIHNVGLFIRLNLNGSTFSYTPDRFEATPIRTRAEAERIAFEITMLNPDLLHKIEVVLL